MISTNKYIKLISTPQLFWVILGIIGLLELIITTLSSTLGVGLNCVLLVGLIWFSGLSHVPEIEKRFLLALSLVPLLRIVSLSLPLTSLPRLAWYPIIAIPLLLAVWLIAQSENISRFELGLTTGKQFSLQLMLAGGGFGLGSLAYYILKPAPLITNAGSEGFWLAALVLTGFSSFVEELIFMGLLGSASKSVLGNWRLVYIAILISLLNIGNQSLLNLLFVFGISLAFGVIVRSTGSIVGVTLVHGLMNITLFVIMPNLMTNNLPGWATTLLNVLIFGGLTLVLTGLLLLMIQKLKAYHLG